MQKSHTICFLDWERWQGQTLHFKSTSLSKSKLLQLLPMWALISQWCRDLCLPVLCWPEPAWSTNTYFTAGYRELVTVGIFLFYTSLLVFLRDLSQLCPGAHSTTYSEKEDSPLQHIILGWEKPSHISPKHYRSWNLFFYGIYVFLMQWVLWQVMQVFYSWLWNNFAIHFPCTQVIWPNSRSPLFKCPPRRH